MTKTSNYKFLIALRLLAGLPLLGFGILHFISPEHMREILVVSGIPLVEMNLFLAPAAEILAGALLLLGWYARIGGMLGIGTMLVAVYSTVVLSQITADTLPQGVTEIPFVPPLPLPIIVLGCSFVVVLLGGGAWSLDLYKQSGPHTD